MTEETVFYHMCKKNQFLILQTFFLLLLLNFVLYFIQMVLFPSNHIKIMLKIIKLTLNINVERDVCSHHTV